MATKKENQVEVLFTDNVTLDGMPYTQGKTAMLDAAEAESLFLSGYAVEYTDDLRVAEEKRKQLPQNVPLKESDVIIATHDSGEQVAYKDNREKGPLDAHPTPTLADTQALGGNAEAHAIAAAGKGKGGRRVEELPVGDLPTGVPIGVMEQAQVATKGLKANTAHGAEIDSAEAAKARSGGADEDEKKKSSKK